MAMIDVNTDPTRNQLRVFGVVWLVFFGVLMGLLWRRVGLGPWVAVAGCNAVVVPILGWLWPAFMRLVFVGMSYLAWPIGFVVSHTILAAVYYGLVTPIGLLLRIVGYDPLARRSDPDGDSYWLERSPSGDGLERYFRQF